MSKAFSKEIDKLDLLHQQSPEYSMQLNYLQTMVELPWGEFTTDNLDLKRAQKVLDRDHYGMEKVKERILEYIAVLQLRGDLKSPIICLYGPPGVGKTSLGKSIAAGMKRKYVRNEPWRTARRERDSRPPANLHRSDARSHHQEHTEGRIVEPRFHP